MFELFRQLFTVPYTYPNTNTYKEVTVENQSEDQISPPVREMCAFIRNHPERIYVLNGSVYKVEFNKAEQQKYKDVGVCVLSAATERYDYFKLEGPNQFPLNSAEQQLLSEAVRETLQELSDEYAGKQRKKFAEMLKQQGE